MSDYFTNNAGSLAFPEANDTRPGLRRAQRGAIFALGSHFSLLPEAALVSMPTGTGKTAVLMMAPYLLKANRALVITPSRMVRDQIAEEFGSLTLLKRLSALPNEVTVPQVRAIESKILRQDQWTELENADVVVTTPMGSSPALDDVPHPPTNLFDLLLIDEAHHSPAKTWSALIQAFPASRQILFTATPFRRDRKLLPGRFVYEFPLREALRDGVFGTIQFVGCDIEPGTSNDVVIARKAEEQYRADRTAGFDHRLMVRTDSRTRAGVLQEIYARNTSLQLSLIHGQHSLRYVRRAIHDLRNGTLDGVICVDMFGEGVDMPQLKIAAIHAPHRSLAVTLQFIGRFARTGGQNLGEAKFVAIPEEIESETKALYRQGAVWEDLVVNLADSRVTSERQLREQLRSFATDVSAASDTELSLAVIKPWYHCKVFHVGDSVDLHKSLVLPGKATVKEQFVSDDLHCAVYVCELSDKPRWVEVPAVLDVENQLFIVFHDTKHKLLFINASVKTEDMYSQIAEQLVDGPFRGLSTATINRALRALQQPSFFNVGLKNRLFGNQVESYRIIAGTKADGAVSNTDAQLFDRGHLFGSGESGNDGSRTTLGISTLSKVWSNQSGFIPEFVDWCRALAEHVSNSAPVLTGSRIDLLATGEEVSVIPAPVIGAAWHDSVYKNHPVIAFDGSSATYQLIEIDLEIVSCDQRTVSVAIVGLPHPVTVTFTIDGDTRYVVTSPGGEPKVRFRISEGTLQQFLNSYGLHLYLADFSRLHNNQLFRSNLQLEPYPAEAYRIEDWKALGIDITREFGTSKKGVSIHDGLRDLLSKTDAVVVIYDHRPGEVADFVVLSEPNGNTVTCDVYHCKKSGAAKAGHRVEDAYEVVGQIIKSVVWARAPSGLKAQLTRRLATGSIACKGTLHDMERLFDQAESTHFEFRVHLVQPGIASGNLTEDVQRILAAGYDYVRTTTGRPPQFWCSQ